MSLCGRNVFCSPKYLLSTVFISVNLLSSYRWLQRDSHNVDIESVDANRLNFSGVIHSNCTGYFDPNATVSCNVARKYSICPWELLRSYKVRWQMVSTVYPERVQVYSAYFDDILIRYVIIYWCEWDSNMWKTRFPYQLLCVFFDKTMRKSEIVIGKQDTRYFLFCDPPKSFLPKYVVVMKNETQTSEEFRFAFFPITDTSKTVRVKKGDLAVCAMTISHYDNEYLMPSQYIESYLLHGASKIYFYYRTSLAPIRKLLDLYAQQGKIVVVPWRGGELCSVELPSFFCQLAMSQDCLYRVRYEYETVIVGDHDELIWSPNRTLVEFVREKFANPLVGGIVLRQTFYPRTNLEPEWSTYQDRIRSFYYDNLPFTKYQNRSAPAWPGYGTKHIVRPALVQKLWVHMIKEYVNNSEEIVTLDPDPAEAIVRHYRNWTEYRNFSKQDVFKFGNFSVEKLTDFGQTFLTNLVDNVFDTFVQLQRYWNDLFDQAEFWDHYEHYKVDNTDEISVADVPTI